MADAPRVIANVTSYEELIAALRWRVNELNVAGEQLDDFAGLPRGYLSKLVGARPIRRLGMTSFAPVLAGLGLRLLVIEDPELMARLSRLPPRQAQYVRPGMRGGSVQISLTASFMQRIRKKGGENSRKYLGKRLVKQLARKAANARWRSDRAV